MRRIVVFLAGTVTAVVLLFGYHTSTSGPLAAATAGGVAPGSATSGHAAAGGSSGGTGPGGSGGSGGSGSDRSATRTVTGPVVQTEWGPVQVQLTVAAGRITDVTVLQQPSGNPQDDQINAYALPILVQEAVDAQSAHIDMVSGATVTSYGFLQSLRGAVDQAAL